jgi:aryl-phospho-beta-D-glucosidase BglC (GH1 family)
LDDVHRRSYIHHNNIHHCQQSGFGYGIDNGWSSAIIEANIFDYCRHFIAGNRTASGEAPTNYEARYNLFGANCTSHGLDCHGGNDINYPTGDKTVAAGGTILGHHNTFRNLSYSSDIAIRGVPTVRAEFWNNWNYKSGPPKTVYLQALTMYGLGDPATSYMNMSEGNNWFGLTPPPSELKKMWVSVDIKKHSTTTTTWGMNLDGLQFTPETIHGQYGNQYIKPTTAELDYFRSKRMTVFRLGFMWERVQHALYSDLDPTDIGYLDDVVNAAIARGLQVYIEPHNYGRYRNASTQVNSVLGSPEVPNAAFADLWTKLASHFKGRVWGYELMNEPHDMGGAAIWKNAAQAAISAIRAVDSATPIIIPGYGWSSAWGWDTWAGSDDLKTLIDPGNNLIFAAHQYFDSDTTGTYKSTDPLPANPLTRGEALLSPFINWLRANGKRGLIGEIGVPSDQFWLDVLKPTLDYLAASKDVLTSIQLHTAGPWWPASYTMCLDPYTDGSDKPQMVLLGNYIR